MPSCSYEKVTTDVRHQIEQVAGTVREHTQAQNLAATLWWAFRLWERIARSDQQKPAMNIEAGKYYFVTKSGPSRQLRRIVGRQSVRSRAPRAPVRVGITTDLLYVTTRASDE